MPSTRRPPDRWFTVAACFASSAALPRKGTRRMEVISRIRRVTAAAAPRVTSGSVLPYTRRSITPSVEKPRSSAAMAHSMISRPLVPGMVEGSPMPMSIPPKPSFRPSRRSSCDQAPLEGASRSADRGVPPGAKAGGPGRVLLVRSRAASAGVADIDVDGGGCRTRLVVRRQIGDLSELEVDAGDDRIEILLVLADLAGVVVLEDADERVPVFPAAPQYAVGLEADDDGVAIRP